MESEPSEVAMHEAISELKVGDRAKILGYNPCDKAYRQKLLVMGLTPGEVIELVRVAPLGDPVQILLRGFVLSLRKSEAVALKLLKLEKVK